MAGYTRQSSSEIQTGEVVLAAPINAEFNAIEAAFHATTGHTHSGSAADGPKISVANSVSGILKPDNGGTGAAITSTVDNTVPRFNGTTGIMQTSTVVINDTGDLIAGNATVTTNTSADQLTAVGSTVVGLLIENTDDQGSGFITFGDGAIDGRITYSHATASMTFTTSASTVLVLDSGSNATLSGNFTAVDGTFSGDLSASGHVSVGDDLGVDGACTLGSVLAVAGGATFAAQVGIGTFSATGATNGKVFDSTVQILDSSRSISSAASHLRFYNPNGLVGSISTSGTTTAYGTSSDGRLKKNLRTFDSGSLLDSLAIYKFDWKSGGSGYGVIAQEVKEVFPDAVVLPEFKDDMLSVDYSKFIPLLIEEVKQLRKRVQKLEGQ